MCPRCESECRPLTNPCPRCAAPAGGPHACWPPGAPVEAMVAVHDYRGPMVVALRTAKLEGLEAAWSGLATGLADRVRATHADVDVVTWVTTPPARVRDRGVDHAEVLARVIGAQLQVPCRRLLDATQCSGVDRYRLRHALPASTVLLVDDVVTTGATLWRAAHVLRQAGAGSVVAAVIARAGSHPLGGERRPVRARSVRAARNRSAVTTPPRH